METWNPTVSSRSTWTTFEADDLLLRVGVREIELKPLQNKSDDDDDDDNDRKPDRVPISSLSLSLFFFFFLGFGVVDSGGGGEEIDRSI